MRYIKYAGKRVNDYMDDGENDGKGSSFEAATMGEKLTVIPTVDAF